MENSALAKLAAEIRNGAYELVFRRPSPIIIRPGRSWRRRLTTDQGSETSRPTSLLRTCRQINAGCSQLFYATTNFQIEHFGLASLQNTPLKFFTMIGRENCAALQNFCVIHPIDITADVSAESRRWDLLCWMVKLRHTIHYFSVRSLIVYYTCHIAREAFWLQGLPPDIECDLQNLGDLWEEQIEALIMQSNIWEQTENQFNSNRWLASGSLKIADILRTWKRLLEEA